MNAIILSALIIGLVNCSMADLEADYLAFEKACCMETKTTEKEALDFWEDNVDYNKITPNMKCHLKCVMEKMGHFKAGVFDVEKAAKDWNQLAEDVNERLDLKVFVACKNETGSNDCETAFKIYKCLRTTKV